MLRSSAERTITTPAPTSRASASRRAARNWTATGPAGEPAWASTGTAKGRSADRMNATRMGRFTVSSGCGTFGRGFGGRTACARRRLQSAATPDREVERHGSVDRVAEMPPLLVVVFEAFGGHGFDQDLAVPRDLAR